MANSLHRISLWQNGRLLACSNQTSHTDQGQKNLIDPAIVTIVLMLTLSNRTNREVKPLMVGQTFETWPDLHNSITKHGISKERVIETIYKDRTRYAGRCKMHDGGTIPCKWYLRAIFSTKTKVITIMKFEGTHTCDSSDVYARQMHTKSTRLADHVFNILLHNKMTRACSLRDTLKAHVHPDVQYHSALAAKGKAMIKIDGDEKKSFHLIPAHLRHILERDPGATVQYCAPDGHLFVCPSSSNNAIAHCRPLVAFDGTHTRSKFPQMLLIASGIDANQTVVLLAYGMAPQENSEEWLWFLELLCEAMPKLCDATMMFQYDREKGLLDGVEYVFPNSPHVFCTWHLGKNIRKQSNKQVMKMFDGLVFAVTPEEFDRRLERIGEFHERGAEYIKQTAHPRHYSRAFIPGIRWGKETSQHAESLNRHIKLQRSLAAFQQSCGLWDYAMTHYYDKKKLAEATVTPFAPNIMQQLKDIEEAAHSLIAQRSSDIEVQITDKNGRFFLVNLAPEWKCSCGDFQDKRMPCKHAWRAITTLKKVHFDFVDPLYSKEAYMATYFGSIPALLNQDFEEDPNCGPSLLQRKRGRPSEKSRLRYREEEGLRNQRRCGVCAQRGHDRRTCPVLKPKRAAILEEQAAMAAADEECSEDSEDSYSSAEDNDENLQPNIVQQDDPTEIDNSEMSFTQLLEKCWVPD